MFFFYINRLINWWWVVDCWWVQQQKEYVMSSKRLLRTSKYFCVVSILEFFQTNFKIHIVLLSISENVKILWKLPSHWSLPFLSRPLIGWAVHIEPERPGYQQNSVFLSRSILRHSSGTWTKKQIFKISKRKQKKHTPSQFSKKSKSLSVCRFVLYQLSKNLNRPFFVDFLTHLSIRYTEQGGKLDDEDPEETGDI